MKPDRELGTQLGLSISIVLTIYFLSPPHLSADMRGQVWMLSPKEDFLSIQFCCHTVL
jgi:hypothetical protein